MEDKTLFIGILSEIIIVEIQLLLIEDILLITIEAFIREVTVGYNEMFGRLVVIIAILFINVIFLIVNILGVEFLQLILAVQIILDLIFVFLEEILWTNLFTAHINPNILELTHVVVDNH